MCYLSKAQKPLVMLRSIAVFPKIHPYHYMQNSGKIPMYQPANFLGGFIKNVVSRVMNDE